MRKKKSYKGLQKDIRKAPLPKIDVWLNKYPDRDYTVSFDTPEFTCICPKTGLPDFAHIFIEYTPGRFCVELKSFKEYIVSYRALGIFHEHAVNRVLDDLVRACKPRRMKVRGVFNTRGGIKTTVEAEYGE